MDTGVISLLLAAYLLGAIPFVYLLGRLSGVDLRDEGSQNVGGTNLWRTVGPLTGVMGAALDIGKGLALVLVARALDFSEGVAGLAAIAAVVGQCWPIFLRFRGGRGISVVAGAVVAFSPMAFVWAVLPALTGLAAYVIVTSRQRQDAGTIISGSGGNSRTVPLCMMFSMVAFALRRCRPGRVVHCCKYIRGTFASLALAPSYRRPAPGLGFRDSTLYPSAQSVSLRPRPGVGGSAGFKPAPTNHPPQ